MEAECTKSGIGRRLQKILKFRGQSLTSFSRSSGIPYRTLQNWVKGTSKPSTEQLEVLAGEEIDIHFLVTGSIAGRPPSFFQNHPPYAQEEVLGDEILVRAIRDEALRIMRHAPAEHIARMGVFGTLEFVENALFKAAMEFADVVETQRRALTPVERIVKMIRELSRLPLDYFASDDEDGN